VLKIPAVRTVRINPAAIPPVVSIEKDFPGTKPFASLAATNNFTKVKPDMRQKGMRTRKVNIILTRNEGVSPGCRKNRDRSKSKMIDIMGLNENSRLILRRSFKDELPAANAPIAEVISHDARNVPEVSS